jgi:hypothetical protein
MTAAATIPIVFDQRLLRHYDRLLEFTCNRIWHCPIRRTLELVAMESARGRELLLQRGLAALDAA